MNLENSFILLPRYLQEGKTGGNFIICLPYALLFILSATCFYRFHKGLFFYQENKSLFVFSGEFIQKFLMKPGGLLEYSGIFFTQLYYNAASGAIIVSSFLVLLSIVLTQISKRLSDGKYFSLILILLPSCLLMVLQTNYDHLMFMNLGFLFVALWFLFSVYLRSKRLNLFIIALFPLFFFLIGSFTFIYLGIFIVYTFIYEKRNLRYANPACLIITALITFLVFKEVLFLQPADRLLHYPISVISFSELPALLYILCGYIIFLPLIIKIIGSVKVNQRLSGIFHLIMILILFSTTVFLLSKLRDRDLANSLKLEKYLYEHDWEAIILQHETTPSLNIIGQYYYNLALSEEGQLCERLFFGRQDFGAGALILPDDGGLNFNKIYFYYAVGLINEVHHIAVESLVINGYSPENVKFLIKTELINGNYRVAERFINVQKKTLHYKRWAEKYERMLDNPELIISDPELGEKIRMLPKRSFFVRPDDMQNIELLLDSNPDNKRAFEYKMARLLFEKDLETIVGEVKKMKEMGYTCIPRYIEEAIVGSENYKNGFPVPGDLTVSSRTELRFKQFMTAYEHNKMFNHSLIELKMKSSWGNTYWFYHEFR